jgi:hypothetical protein
VSSNDEQKYYKIFAMNHRHPQGYNQREEHLEPKRSALEQHDCQSFSNAKLQENFKCVSSIPDARLHQKQTAIEECSVLSSSLNENDIIESVAWTKKLDKFLKRPAISKLLETHVTKSSAGAQKYPTLMTCKLPKINLMEPRSDRLSKSTMTYKKKPDIFETSLDQEFIDQADSVDRILKIASKRHITQLELEALRRFTQSETLCSQSTDEPEYIKADPSKNNRQFGRRSGIFRIPTTNIKNDLQNISTSKAVKNSSLPLSQRSDISVPAYLFDEQNSSKVLPDFRRIDKRRIIRQQQWHASGGLSLLGPNEESDSDPCSDECESSEKETVTILNAYKPALLRQESGMETVEHDELNAYSDFCYAANYQRAFAEEVASLETQSMQHSAEKVLTKEMFRLASEKLTKPSEDISMPETSINWKTSVAFSDAAASEYCRFCILHKLPIYNTVIRASSTHSHHKNASFSGDTIHAIAHYFKHASKSIQELVINSCSLGNEEFRFLGVSCFQHMNGTLACLKLIDCNFCNGGNILKTNLALLNQMSHIQLSDCKMRDTDCASVFIGLAQSNPKCTFVYMDHNFASTLSADAISKCFRYDRCCWKILDLSWNRMSPSRIMCASIRHCDHLSEINLSWNGLRDEIALNAMCYALRFHPEIRLLNLQNCGLGDKHALLLTDLLSDCMKLVSIDLRSNPIHSYGCRSILRVLGLRHQKAECDAQGSEVCNVMLPLSGGIAESFIDYDKIAGSACFSLSSPSDRHILKRLVFKRERQLISFTDDSFRIHGNDLPAPADKLHTLLETFDASDLSYHNALGSISSLLNTFESQKSEIALDSNTLSVTIQNLVLPPTEDMLATSWEINFVKNIHSSSEFSMEQKIQAVSFLLGGPNVFRLEQLKELILLLKPGCRVEAVKLAMTHCWETNGSEQLLGYLSSTEQKKVETQVPEELLHFAPNNPTGHYRLMLSNRFDRDICYKLLAIRNDILDVLKRDKSYQASRHKIEKVAFNVKLEGRSFTITSDWNVPNNGILELDFVYCLHPDPTAFTEVDDETVFEFTMVPHSAQRKQIKILRGMSNQYLFTCAQAMRIMQYFRDDSLKVESLVILFSRIIDYPGFLRLVKALDGPKQILLRKRIGSHNLYIDCNAVGFHELDLTDPQQRYVCGRLVDLAVIEPGENMCGCRYNEIDFDVPSSWLQEIPQKGVFTVFYCRSAQVIKKIFQKIPEQCIPNNLDLLSPSGTEWVMQAKRSRIKLKLSLAFTNVEEAFNKMDEDGGGSLSRLEFSRGLRMLGVQVTAYELLELVDLLDEDGSGFIELEEMVSFWESC